MIKYIDLFAGIGGFHYGLERCHGDQRQVQAEQADAEPVSMPGVNDVQESVYSCVYANEWDKYANSVYRRHYEECDNRDIRTVDAKDIPDHELLCGGFPCQSFSVAGKRGGFDDTRGTLFFEIARIVQQKQPRLLLLENVKGLLSHDQGRTFGVILNTLDELGYDTQWQVCNSKDFGVPQNRERVFIVGHFRGTSRPQVFPLERTNSKDIIQLNETTHSNDRIYGEDGLSPTLNTMQGGRRQPKVMRQPLKFLKRNQKNIEGDCAFTVDASQTSGLSIDAQIRRLTPKECERLQGFPDDWTALDEYGKQVSDTQRYKMCGNAVTTNVITEIAKRLVQPR